MVSVVLIAVMACSTLTQESTHLESSASKGTTGEVGWEIDMEHQIQPSVLAIVLLETP